MKRLPQALPATCFLLAALLFPSSCASTSAPIEPSSTARILEVPFVLQKETYACGLVSLQSLCSYWNVAIDDVTRARLASTAQGEAGLTGTQMRAELELLGFQTFLFHGKLDSSATGVFRHIDAGRPPLLMLSPKPDHGHYVLFVGYDEAKQNVCLLDPARGCVQESYQSFEQSWAATEHFTLLAIPHPPVPTVAKKAE